MSITPPPLFRQLWIVNGLDGEICIPAEIVELIYDALWNGHAGGVFGGVVSAKLSFIGDRVYHLHPQLGPAWVFYTGKDKELQCVEYHWHGKLHRPDDKPTKIYFYSNGNIKREMYYQNGKPHRIDGPAIYSYYETGELKTAEYIPHPQTSFSYIPKDPFFVEYHKNGEVMGQHYKTSGGLKFILEFTEDGFLIPRHQRLLTNKML